MSVYLRKIPKFVFCKKKLIFEVTLIHNFPTVSKINTVKFSSINRQ